MTLEESKAEEAAPAEEAASAEEALADLALEGSASPAFAAYSFDMQLSKAAAETSPASQAAAERVAEGEAQWLEAFWASKQRKHGVALVVERGLVRVQGGAPGDTGEEEFEARWRKEILSTLKKVEVEDLGDMQAASLWESIPLEDSNGRGRQDLAALEKELSVKVVFCCEGGHVLLVGAKAKLQKKCFVVRNLLSHYHWRLSGRDVAFEAMTATK